MDHLRGRGPCQEKLENHEPTNAFEAVRKRLNWFRYQSPVRNFGSHRLDDLRLGYTKCFLLVIVVEVIDWLNSVVNPKP